MYNAHTALKKIKESQRAMKADNAQKRWEYRYNHEVRARLLEHYDARIKSFIHKMQENPIVFHNNPQSPPAKSNSSTFRFKNNEDFTSLFTPLERMEIKRNEQILLKKFGDASLAYKNINSDSAYRPLGKIEFRVREKLKQIKPKNTEREAAYNQFIQQRRNKSRVKEVLSKTKIARNKTETNQSLIRDTSKSSLKIADDGKSSMHSNVEEQSVQDTLEKEAMEYEKSKEINQKKMHFQNVMRMLQKIDDQSGKKALKNILIKCGLCKEKIQFSREETQGDVFV